jgi:tripartite-type tricarboxylate transporter receptor subunit TctC
MPGAAWAQGTASYPSKPITIVVPFPPGASTDLMARYIAPKLREALGQPVIVENKGGAGGMLGAAHVAKAAPDGHTLLLASSTVHNSPLLQKNPTYDSNRDLTPIIAIMSHPFVLVANSALPVKNTSELIAYAKKNPGKLNFATLGGYNDIFCEAFKKAAGVDIHLVHYRGAAENTIGVIRGDAHLTFNGHTFVQAQINAGQLRLMGFTSLKRSKALPDIPTVAEGGAAGFEVINMVGILAPAGTPKPVIDKLNAEIARIVGTPEAKEFITTRGNDIVEDSSPGFYVAAIKRETDNTRRIIEEIGYQKK